MRFTNGWIKLHRKCLISGIMNDTNKINIERFGLWCYILICCTVRETKVCHKGKEMVLPVGSMTLSIKDLAEATSCSRSKIKRALDYMHSSGAIELKTSRNGTIIIVNNWEQYQSLSTDLVHSSEHIADISRTCGDSIDEIDVTPIEEVKNIRIKNIRIKKKRKAAKKSKHVAPLVKFNFLEAHLIEWISGVSDTIRLRWKKNWCEETISYKLQSAHDWADAKDKKVSNVASLMNTFFKDAPHDQWKDVNGGCDPEEKALSDHFNELLEEGKREMSTNA